MTMMTHLQDTAAMFATNFTNNIASLEVFFRTHYSPLYLMGGVLAVMLLLRLTRTQRVVAKVQKSKPTTAEFVTQNDVSVIAGDNPIATKLDLARAYIEMDKKHLAKSILFNVQKQGTEQQQLEAKQLLDTL